MRVERWEARLAAALEAARDQPFAWGTHDCCIWASGVRDELTGCDDTALFRGRYTTEIGALRRLRKLGWQSIEEAATALMGQPRANIFMAQRGDIALIDDPAGGALEALGVVMGKVALFLRRDRGLEPIVLRACRLVWAV